MANVTSTLPRELSGSISSMIRVGAVTADAVGVEEADAEHEVVDGAWRAPSAAPPSASPEWKTNDGSPSRVEERDLGNLDLARAPSALDSLEHVLRQASLSGDSPPADAGGVDSRRPAARPPPRPWPSSSPAAALRSSRRLSGRRRRRAADRPVRGRGPSSSQSASSQKRSTTPSECVTSRIVLPRRRNSANLSRHLWVKPSSPTASTSSTSSTSGST